MADKIYNIPGSGESYFTSAGNLSFEIIQDESTASNQDARLLIERVGNLSIDFSVKPSANDRRFSSFSFDVINKDNILETSGILNEAHKKDTKIIIYLDGSEIWRGVLVWEKIQKKEWNGSFYESIRLFFMDIMYLLTDKTISDFSYSDGMYFETLLNNIAAGIGVSFDIPGGYEIQEYSGYSRTFSEIKISGFDTSYNAIDFLKKFAESFGLDFFVHSGKLFFLKKTGLPDYTVSEKAEKIERIQEAEEISFISVKCDFVWLGSINKEHLKTYGTQDVKTEKNKIIDCTGFIDKLYFDRPSVPPNTNPDIPGEAIDSKILNSEGDFQVKFDPTAGVDFTDVAGAKHCESGMVFISENSTPAISYQSIVFDIIDENNIVILNADNEIGQGALDLSDTHYINRSTKDELYKPGKFVNLASSIYNNFFLNYSGVFKFSFIGILPIAKQYVFAGNKYSPRKIVFDFYKNSTVLESRRIF